MAQTIVAHIVKKEPGVSYSAVAVNVGVGESTLRRWCSRARKNIAVLSVPGPKKLNNLCMKSLMVQIDNLHHRRHRTAGTTALWQEHMDSISRRDFSDIISRYRARLLEEERNSLWKYKWKKVGALWAMDDMYFCHDEHGSHLRIHNVMDVGSRFMFEPLDGTVLTAKRVAENLESLIVKNGAPICLKSDWGSNLAVSEEVSSVLAEHCIIPLLSPPRYPRYNGVIERGQSDTRRAVEDLLGDTESCPAKHFGAYAVAGTLRRNIISRDIFDGKSAHTVFQERKSESKTTIRERRKIYDWIEEKKESILLSIDGRCGKRERNAAMRCATEEWLLLNDIIEIIPGDQKVSTYFGDYERS
jgi:transposase InsO family protein